MPRLNSATLKSALCAGQRQELWDDAVKGLHAVVTPAGTATFAVRYRTPTGQRRLRLGRFGTLTLEQARNLARQKLGEVAKGADPQGEKVQAATEAPVTIESVIAGYISDAGAGWKPTTHRTYASALNAFMTWAKAARVKTTEHLDARALGSYRAHAIRAGRKTKANGGSRHEVVELDQRRSPAAINCELRAVKSCLTYLRRFGRLPHLGSDDIADALRLVVVDRDRPDPFKPDDLRQLLRSAVALDASSPKDEAIAPLVAVVLLAGLRLGEAIRLQWEDLDLTERTIRVGAGKTGRERLVDLAVSPGLASLVAAMRRVRGEPRLFAQHTLRTAGDGRLRLIEFGAPAFQWSQRNSRIGERSSPTLRSTCGSYLANAPGIFGGASIYRTAAQLGHSVQVAERHYLGVLRSLDPGATTLEAAMGVEPELELVIAGV